MGLNEYETIKKEIEKFCKYYNNGCKMHLEPEQCKLFEAKLIKKLTDRKFKKGYKITLEQIKECEK